MSEPIRILYIEDNSWDRRIISDILSGVRSPSFILSTAETLSEGSTGIQSNPPDIILLDLNLPDSEGLPTFRAVAERLSHEPVVICSAVDDEETAVRALKEGAQDYLTKGKITPDILVRTLRYALERKRIEDSLRAARDSLERRVRERTADLEAANERLTREAAERLRAEASLRESEHKWRNLFETSTDAVIIASTDRDSFEINRAGLELFGFGEGDIATRHPGEIFRDPKAWPLFMERIDRRGSVKDYEAVLVRKDGAPLDCLISAVAIRDGSGTIIGYQGIVRDITTRKRVIDKTLNTVADGVFIIDAAGIITYFNAAAERILGIPHGKALKRHYSEITIRVRTGIPRPLFNRAIRALIFWNRMMSSLRAMRTAVPVSLSVSHLSDTSGNGIGAVVTFRDLTAL